MSVPLRLPVALCAVVASGALVVASDLTWLSLPDGAGGTTAVSGWGVISGGSQIAGGNINDAMNGNATFRPGVLGLIIGIAALVAAGAVLVVVRGPRPHRIPAAVEALCGAAASAWGIVRIRNPDSVGVLQPGEGSSGAGPWVTTGAGILLLAVAIAVLTGLLDPPRPPARRGMSPARR